MSVVDIDRYIANEERWNVCVCVCICERKIRTMINANMHNIAPPPLRA